LNFKGGMADTNGDRKKKLQWGSQKITFLHKKTMWGIGAVRGKKRLCAGGFKVPPEKIKKVNWELRNLGWSGFEFDRWGPVGSKRAWAGGGRVCCTRVTESPHESVWVAWGSKNKTERTKKSTKLATRVSNKEKTSRSWPYNIQK